MSTTMKVWAGQWAACCDHCDGATMGSLTPEGGIPMLLHECETKSWTEAPPYFPSKPTLLGRIIDRIRSRA